MVAGPGAAQQFKIEKVGCGGENSTFGDDCSVQELIDSVDSNGQPNGAIIYENLPLDPPVTIIIDRFEAENNREIFPGFPSPIGIPPTDFDDIRVFTSNNKFSNSVIIGFSDNFPAQHWTMFGGSVTRADGALTHDFEKRDRIKFRVRAVNPQTNQSTARIKDAALSLPGELLGTQIVRSVDPNEPAQVEVTEEIRNGNTGLADLRAFERANGNFEVSDSRDSATFVPQSVIEVEKDIKLQPGGDPNNFVDFGGVVQSFSLTANEEVGCGPGTIFPAGGGQETVEVCEVPQTDSIPSGEAVIAQDDGSVEFPTSDRLTGGDQIWHRIVSADDGATLVDDFTKLDPTFPPTDPSNTVRLSDFDSLVDKLSAIIAERDQNGSSISRRVDIVDLLRGGTGTIVRIGDTENIRGDVRELVEFLKLRGLNNPKVVVDVDLLIPGTFIRIAAILVYDISQIFEDGSASLNNVILPNDTVQTDQGPLTHLNNLVETAAVNKATNAILVRGTGTGFPADRNLVLVEDSGTGQGRLVASTGETIGSDEVISLQLRGSVNGQGDVAYEALTGPPGATFPSGSAAMVSPASGGALTVLRTGDPVPGVSGAQVQNILGVGINDARQGVVYFKYLDANIFKPGLLGFGFDDTTMTLNPAPLLTADDTVTDSGGLTRGVAFFQMDPRGVGANSVGVGALLDDNTNTVLILPLSAEIAIVPDVTGFDQASAEALIVADGFVVGTVTQQVSNTVPVGEVISQSPAAGTEAAPDSAVDLVVSAGPALAIVPDVIDLPRTDAEAAIVAAGLAVGTVSTRNSATVPAGETISQSPVAGTQVPFGSGVDLVASSGPVVNNVPPAVDAGPDAILDEGDTFLSAGSFSDPGADTWTATVDYGDGSGVQSLPLNPDGSFALSNLYDDDGVYTVTVTITDDDGGVGIDTATVTVNNVAAVQGDLDGDGDVDRDDVNTILAARNQPASGPDDPRDIDGDGVITVLDARRAVTMCTRPRCATE